MRGGGNSDYTLLDAGNGGRLERWGGVTVARPDVRATGARALPDREWDGADAVFAGRVGGGRWIHAPGRSVPDRWPIAHAGLRFSVGCAPSGHMGLFPEQQAHWAWMIEALSAGVAGRQGHASDEPATVLNLFAYTGGASVALARAGARVTHVDASRPAIGWAQENATLNGVATIRWIQEDARRFVDREHRRGRRYDALLLDPPPFGRGPAGDWQLDRDLGNLLEGAAGLLRPEPAFVLLNVYSGSLTALDLAPLLGWALDRPDVSTSAPVIDADTLWLSVADGRELPTGVFARATWRRPADRG